MLSFIFTDINDREITLTNPLNLSINMEENVPAHDMCVSFLYTDTHELVSVTMTDENNVLFVGVVDEQIRVCDDSGDYLKIVARSMAAKLLDNESVPISYTHPTKEVILKNHANVVSVYCDDTEDDTYFGVQTVRKGFTNWQAVEDFSKNMYHTTPMVSELGILSFENPKKDITTVFSNSGDGVKFQSFYECKKRCEEISKVRIKATNSGGYHTVVENEDACNRKIQRERYLNAVFTNTPVVYAKNMIESSKKKSYYITLKCVGCHIGSFMGGACVKLSDAKMIKDLYVSSVRYNLSNNTDMTTIMLKRKEV